MKAVRISKPGGPLELVDIPIPAPPPDWVRIQVHACGVCHSDAFVKEGHWPGLQYPRIPGHEVAGVIDEVGANVKVWKKGQRVGVGWYGGHDGVCDRCRRGLFVACRNGGITGFTQDGGYAEYMIAPAQSLAAMPDGLSPEEAAPLLCAGITTFNALRHSGAVPGDLVAIQAIGGLGHLGVQFASKFGYRVVAISRGDDAKDLALKLGAVAYLNSDAVDAAAELQRMGGAKVILSTAPSGKAMSAMIDGLDLNGELIVVGASMDPIEVPPVKLIGDMRAIKGWASGIATDSEDTLKFCEMTGVRPMIETFPLSDAPRAFERMLSGKARFRVVLTM
ncbi:MAG TPA: alcohol dehydrogenase [Bryobacteraceae bacterium]|jgi:D-arabinose 1-dehydrogenase-like Zn-dependent alcohol dehydrogenase